MSKEPSESSLLPNLITAVTAVVVIVLGVVLILSV